MLTASEIRQKFIEYFKENGHSFQKSASLIPEDKTVLLTIAGMIPFKPYFMGKETPPFKRATSAQKCIRTNDIDNVGQTPRHHTFFEMLGNFSFGDYFKKEAIYYSWDFLTHVLGIQKEKLFVSIFKDDDESGALWLSETDITSDRIIRLGEKDNFWEAGHTGPCGPCSEIYYDNGADPQCTDKNCAPGCDCNRFVEVWNLVFMQYNKDDKGNLSPLPMQNIDTGMGLERITSVLQNVKSNFETDLFTPITHKIASIAGLIYVPSANFSISLHVIADHIRAATFMIGDGIYPSNDGRGYILKKILRRAMRHGKLLNINKKFVSTIVDVVIKEYGHFYTELKDKEKIILEIIETEEKNFSKTLATGLVMLEDIIKIKKFVSGEDAFKLWDTFGFPLELTIEIAEEKNIKVDTTTFSKLMEEQKERARSSSEFYIDGEKPGGGEAIIAKNDTEKLEMARNHSATHILQSALQEVLGTHVAQSGSLVSPKRLRFDFTNPKGLNDEQIQKVEDIVNDYILENVEVEKSFMAYDDAIATGAMALFTGKYDTEVRVVKMGNFSTELCGGTHVERTGDIGLFKIVSESSISSGIRRIEALTGNGALVYVNKKVNILNSIAQQFKIKPENVIEKVASLQNEIKDQSKQIKQLQQKEQTILAKELIRQKKTIGNTEFIVSKVNQKYMIGDLKKLSDLVKTEINGISCICSTSQDQFIAVITCSNEIVKSKKIGAGALVKELTATTGGKGGGSPFMAQAIWDASEANSIYTRLEDTINKVLS